MSTNIARPRRVHHTIAFMDQIFSSNYTTHKAILPIRRSQNGCDVRMCGAPRVLAQVVGTSEPVAKDVTKKEAGGELLALSDCLCVEQL